MPEFAVTDADTIRTAMTAAIVSILPRFVARSAERFEPATDQEIPGGAKLRLFDVMLSPEEEVIGDQFAGGWYGGGIQLGCDAEIRVSYPVGTPDAQRFAGSDYQDIAGVLVDLHTTIPGMFAIGTDGPTPVLERAVLEGDSGRHVATFRCRVTFFASDEVSRAV